MSNPNLPTIRLFAWAAILLAVFAAVGIHVARHTSPTFDEPDQIADGYYALAHWNEQVDNPYTNINLRLSQMWEALPLLKQKIHFPTGQEMAVGRQTGINYGRLFVFAGGNSPEAIMGSSRTMVVLLGATLAAVLFFWSRRLHGDLAGLVTLAFCCLSPMIIANSAVATTDIATTLLFTLATLALWWMLHRPGGLSIALAGVAVGALAATKVSGLLIVPIALVLFIVRLLGRQAAPPAAAAAAPSKPAATGAAAATPPSWLWPLGSLLAAAGVAWATVWMIYGFHYPMVFPASNGAGMAFATSKSALANSLIGFCRNWRVLPEAYLYDLNWFASAGSIRRAFLDGQYSIFGWWYFFPVVWFYKNPLPFLLGLALAVVAACRLRRTRPAEGGVDWYGLTPLLALGGIYGASALTSNLNIGVRHLLPLYPALLVFAGLVARLPLRAALNRQLLLIGLLGWSAVEAGLVYPHFLAYFNELAGGTYDGYKTAVDSSYEWGEDLPFVAKWLDLHAPAPGAATSVYFSYFGCADLEHYGISDKNVVLLPQFYDTRPIRYYPLGPGEYVISATMLMNIYPGTHFSGPWRASYESEYQELDQKIAALVAANAQGPATLQALEAEEGKRVAPGAIDRLMQQSAAAGKPLPARPVPSYDDLVRLGAQSFQPMILDHDVLRFCRLCAVLKQRAPDSRVTPGMLVFNVGNAELDRALHGPSPEVIGANTVKGIDLLPPDYHLDFDR